MSQLPLGNFSVSLAVKDIAASKAFYEKLGFEMIHGEQDQGWIIMKNGETNIGLFQGMFEKNILTFNPGWDSNGQEVDPFIDIREIQKKLKESGLNFDHEVGQETGASSFMLTDPDGNLIMVDQHRTA